MAYTTQITAARLKFAAMAQALQKLTFDDVTSDPTSDVNWIATASLVDVDLGIAAATPSALTPNEVATTELWGELVTASGTTHALDLVALPRSTELGDLNLDTLKVQGFILSCPFTNTDDVSLAPGATLGYNLMNDAATKVVCAPGGVVVSYFPENTANATGMPDVTSGVAQSLDLASTMSNFQFFMAIYAG